MSRADHLRTTLDRARQRLAYARAELRRFEDRMNDPDDAQAQRTWRKLSDDLKRAEIDCGHAEHALQDAAFDAVFKQPEAAE